MALGCAYEYLRDLQRRVDQKVAIQLVQSGKGKNVVSRRPQNGGRIALEEEEQDELMLSSLKADRGVDVPFGSRVLRASLYGASVFLSFFLMLVFMTYNGYLILATVLGAALGHYIYGGRMDPDAVLGGGLETKGMSCH
ncbi:hypothetical protein FRC17_006905 [Serendipita sp. 399]|nr:hypothetical protein FRC17_006905 [Serendipita sp. 399]